MRFHAILTLVLVLVLATSAYCLEKKALQMREDFGTQPLYDCYMSYYYYIPCPTYSWFWMYTGWNPGDTVGEFFVVGDPSMGRTGSGCPPYLSCDAFNAHTIEQIRILDFAGYGTLYPGLFTVEFQIWCSDDRGCPLAPALWSSGPQEFCAGGWNYIPVTADPPICVTRCATQPNYGYPRFLVTATMTGTDATYPAWGMDNISTPVDDACAMHDTGCCPALYPRPTVSHYNTIHSGYYGPNFTYCPPYWFLDGRDTTDGTVYGFIELAWRVYLVNSGPTATKPSTWGNIKSMYR
jgi:hypothetical protein